MFCLHFDIHPTNCSCPVTPIVCEAITLDTDNNKTTEFRRFNKFTVAYATIAAMSSIFGVAGNGAVVGMAYRYRHNISPCKLHIAELAAVNLVFSTVQIIQVGEFIR